MRMLIVLLTVTLLQVRALPPATVIFDKMVAARSNIEDYTATLEGEISMEGIRVPKAELQMYFKRPNKIRFVSSSFSMVPRDGISPSPDDLRSKYDATTVGEVDSEGVKLYKLQLAAKNPATRLRQVYLWVNAEDWTIRRLESAPYQGRSVTFDFDYQTVEGKYQLFSTVRARFGTVGSESETSIKLPEGTPEPATQIEAMRQRVRSGSVIFRYKNYRVNTGLSDTLFVKPSGE